MVPWNSPKIGATVTNDVSFSHLTSVDVLVGAISITERGTGVVFVNSHVHAIFIFLQHLWLIYGPIEVLYDRDENGTGAPAPRAPTPLQTSRPVVQVASPICFLFISLVKRV
jgi:hypothetical protein